MTTAYWNNNGKYESLAKQLQELIPDEGTVTNPRKNRKLEKFRKASNCYYDLYNNGLCNRARQFAQIFKISTSDYRYARKNKLMFTLYRETETIMDHIILEAAEEQGLM